VFCTCEKKPIAPRGSEEKKTAVDHEDRAEVKAERPKLVEKFTRLEGKKAVLTANENSAQKKSESACAFKKGFGREKGLAASTRGNRHEEKTPPIQERRRFSQRKGHRLRLKESRREKVSPNSAKEEDQSGPDKGGCSVFLKEKNREWEGRVIKGGKNWRSVEKIRTSAARRGKKFKRKGKGVLWPPRERDGKGAGHERTTQPSQRKSKKRERGESPRWWESGVASLKK